MESRNEFVLWSLAPENSQHFMSVVLSNSEVQLVETDL